MTRVKQRSRPSKARFRPARPPNNFLPPLFRIFFRDSWQLLDAPFFLFDFRLQLFFFRRERPFLRLDRRRGEIFLSRKNFSGHRRYFELVRTEISSMMTIMPTAKRGRVKANPAFSQ